MQPTRRSTPMEWQVLFHFMMFGVLCLGAVFFWLSGKAPADTPEIALQLVHMGWACVGGALLAVVLWNLVRRFILD